MIGAKRFELDGVFGGAWGVTSHYSVGILWGGTPKRVLNLVAI